MPKDVLRPKELADIWWKITETEHSEIAMQGGPLGAPVQVTDHCGIRRKGPAVLEMEKVGTIELAEGTPAMGEGERVNGERYESMAVKRQADMAAVALQGKDLAMAQAVSADIDWAFPSEMATRNATRNSTKRVLTAAA